LNKQSSFKSDTQFSNFNQEGIEAMLNISLLRETRIYQEAKQEGKVEGRLESRVQLVPKLLQKGLSIQEIADLLELDVEEVRKAARE
jgi:predicted transposase/invertase (TIGR01784 family)